MSKYIFSLYHVLIFGFLFATSWKESSVSANSSIEFSPSDDCFLQCAEEVSSYLVECLKNCTPNWPFVYGGNCDPENTHFGIDSLVACNPERISYKLLNKTNLEGQVFSYARFSWQPCNSGIADLRGFKVSSSLVYLLQECNVLLFKPNFTLSHAQKDVTISFLSHRLRYGEESSVEVQALPPNSDENPTNLRLRAPTCRELNGKYSCFCGTDGDISLRPPNVTVDGYTVKVNFVPAEDCFEVFLYEFAIYVVQDDNDSAFVDKTELHLPGENQTLQHTFYYFYDSPLTLKVEILAFKHVGSPSSVSSREAIMTTAWKPPKPVVTFPKIWSAAKISFQLPTNYNITTYTIRLSKHDFVDGEIKSNDTVSITNVTAIDARHGNLSKTFFGLTEGTYSVQIREVRPYLKTRIYNPAYWGPSMVFPVEKKVTREVEGVNLNVLLPVILAVTFLTCLIVFTIFFLFMWKKKKCLPFRKTLPLQLVEWLDTQTITLSSKTVLLVWQTDYRSPNLQEKHTEVISRFAAFLRTVCHLDVILDLYDEAEMRRGIGDWVQKAYTRAEVVVFVCPHFDYSLENPSVSSLSGNFRRMYSYAERDLGDRSKFATALLPYSDLASSSATEYLQKMTSVFYLMEHIEDLYFHIQGFSKFDCLGRHGAVNISEHDYQRTPEGSALSNGIREFKELLANYSQTSSLLDCSDSTDDSPSTSSESRCGEEKNPLMMHQDDSSLDEEKEQVPVMIHSLAHVEAPSPSDQLVERNRPVLEPIEPYVDNPEEALRMINERSSGQVMPEQDYCPYHSHSDVILSSKSLSIATDPRSLAYGQDSRSFNVAEIPQVEVKDSDSDKSCPTTSSAHDSGFDSTSV